MSPHESRIGLLSTIETPALGHVIEALTLRHIRIDCVLSDSKVPSVKERAIEEQRTEGKLPEIALDRFTELHIPFYHVGSHLSDASLSLIRKRRIDFLVNAGTPRILNRPVLGAPRVGVVSCHPGLLPNYRVCTCVEWAIYEDAQAGNTVHFMAERIDEGPIILQEPLVFSKLDTYSDIRVTVYRAGFDLLARALEKIAGEDLTPQNLPPQGAGRYLKVISKDKMQAVVNRLHRGEWAYQC